MIHQIESIYSVSTLLQKQLREMTRGNKRDIDRVRSENRHEKVKNKGKNERLRAERQKSGTTYENERERQAEIMREKQRMAEAKKASEGKK